MELQIIDQRVKSIYVLDGKVMMHDPGVGEVNIGFPIQDILLRMNPNTLKLNTIPQSNDFEVTDGNDAYRYCPDNNTWQRL